MENGNQAFGGHKSIWVSSPSLKKELLDYKRTLNSCFDFVFDCKRGSLDLKNGHNLLFKLKEDTYILGNVIANNHLMRERCMKLYFKGSLDLFLKPDTQSFNPSKYQLLQEAHFKEVFNKLTLSASEECFDFYKDFAKLETLYLDSLRLFLEVTRFNVDLDRLWGLLSNLDNEQPLKIDDIFVFVSFNHYWWDDFHIAFDPYFKPEGCLNFNELRFGHLSNLIKEIDYLSDLERKEGQEVL